MAASKKAPAAKKKPAAKVTKKAAVAEQGPLVTTLTVIFALLSAVFVWLAYQKYGM